MAWLKRPSTPGGVIYFVILVLMFVGLGFVATGTWRTGIAILAGCFGLAFVSRCVLSDERAGMLRIRRRFVDLVTMGVCCGSMLVLAFIIPNRA